MNFHTVCYYLMMINAKYLIFFATSLCALLEFFAKLLTRTVVHDLLRSNASFALYRRIMYQITISSLRSEPLQIIFIEFHIQNSAFKFIIGKCACVYLCIKQEVTWNNIISRFSYDIFRVSIRHPSYRGLCRILQRDFPILHM